MTAENSNDTTAQAENQGNTGKSRGRKPGRKRSAASRAGAAKRGRSTTARRSSAKRSGVQSEQSATGRSRSSRSGTSGNRGRSASGRSSSSGFGARLLASAGRAIPLATRGLGDQRMVQRLVDERPYMLGAIGLGIGAMIGLMLPGTLSSMTGRSSRGRR